MNKASKTRINEMIAANTLPQRLKGSEGIALKIGKRIVKLVNDEGESTAAGSYWSAQTGQELPVGGFMQQTATRDGNVESIRLRDGWRGVTGRWNEGSGEYKFTRLGNTYYKTVEGEAGDRGELCELRHEGGRGLPHISRDQGGVIRRGPQ